MSRLTQLKRSAEHYAEKVRKHKLGGWTKVGEHTAINACDKCAAPVLATTLPQAGAANITGRAMAENCPLEERQ